MKHSMVIFLVVALFSGANCYSQNDTVPKSEGKSYFEPYVYKEPAKKKRSKINMRGISPRFEYEGKYYRRLFKIGDIVLEEADAELQEKYHQYFQLRESSGKAVIIGLIIMGAGGAATIIELPFVPIILSAVSVPFFIVGLIRYSVANGKEKHLVELYNASLEK